MSSRRYIGQVVAQYDGSYECEDQEINLKKGEKFFLLEKKNNDWWVCAREDELIPFHVPSIYVAEIDNYIDGEEEEEEEGEHQPDYMNVYELLSSLDKRLDIEENSHEFKNSNEDDDEDEDDDTYDDYEKQLEEINDFNENKSTEIDYVPFNQSEKIDYKNMDPPVPKERKFKSSIILNQEKNTTTQTPEPDYDNSDYINVSKLNEQQRIATPDYTDNDDNDNLKPGKNTNSSINQPIDDVNIPDGWFSSIDKRTNRRVFINEVNKNKWYLAYNDTGKPYFYNNESESIWELPELNENNANNSDLNNDTERKHFVRNCDQELTAFNGINARNSRLLNNNYTVEEQKQPQINYSYKPKEILTEKFKILKLVEGNKKCRKKKFENYIINLAQSKLLFVKENSKPGKLEDYLDFKGGKCYKIETKEQQKITDALKKQKNTFIVETLNGNKVAFVHDISSVIDDWVSAINSIIKQMKSEFSPIYEGPEEIHCTQLSELHQTKTDENEEPIYYELNKSDEIDIDVNNSNEYAQHVISTNDSQTNSQLFTATVLENEKNNNNHQKNKFLNKSKSEDKSSKQDVQVKFKNKKDSIGKKFSEPEIKFEKINSNQSSTINVKTLSDFLNLFLKRRPNIENLKQRGIIKECVFGSNLISLCNGEKRNVPLFVDEIIKAIEIKGLDSDGLYRISGNLSEIQKLRFLISQGKYNFIDSDIHVLSGTLKTFFRELEDPIIPTHMQESLLSALSIQDKAEKVRHIKELLNKMPKAHFETLKTLCRHLINVVAYKSENRMHLQNISLVFGPTMFRLNPLSSINKTIGVNIMLQNEFVEFLLTYYKIFFDISD